MAEEEKEHAPSVVDGKLMRTSVSQLQNADACMRQWAMPRVFGYPKKPEGAGQAKGKAGHKRIEVYLRSGDPSGLEHLELLGIKRGLIPTPGPQLLVEHEFGILDAPLLAHDIPLVGYIDLVDLRTPNLARVTDWKFKKPWNGKLGFDAADLIDPTHEAGIQMIGYAEWVGEALPMMGLGIDLSHVTFQTSGQPDVKPVTAHLAPGQSKPLWKQIGDRLIPRMKRAAAAKSWQEVERVKPDDPLCDAYGGCPYKDPCHDRMARIVAGFKQSNAAKLETKSMGMLNELVGSSAPVVPPPAAVATPAPARKLVFETRLLAGAARVGVEYVVNGVNAKFLCNMPAGPVTFASFMPMTPGQPPLLVPIETEIDFATTAEVAPPLVLPPDAPKSDPLLAAKPAPGTVAVTEAVAGVKAAMDVGPAVPEPKRARAKKTAAVEATAPVEVPETVSEGINIYFGCSPVGKATRTLDAYVAELDAEIQRMAQVEIVDIRVANDQALGFGRWKGFLAKLAKATPPPPGHYVVTKGDERVECVAAALALSAQNVVIGS